MTSLSSDNHAAVGNGPSAVAEGFLGGNGLAILVGVLVTVAIELGLYYGSALTGAGKVQAARGALVAAIVWVILSAPAFAAGGQSICWSFVRGITTADASAVLLIWLWRDSPCLSLPAAAKIYCMLLTLALFGVAVVSLARAPAARFSLAVAASVVMFAAAASPFWTGGLLESSHGPEAARWAVWVNPVYCMTSATSDRIEFAFVWHQQPVLYSITRLGDYRAPPPVQWYTAPLLWGACAAFLATISLAAGFVRVKLQQRRDGINDKLSETGN
jgi:hypothetical protein